MRSKKRDLYVSEGNAQDNLEQLSKKFSSDLRDQIRCLCSDLNVFSKSFRSEVDTIEHLSKIAKIESKPSIVPVCVRGGTLWEREEFCVRFIVEEGKFNPLIRKMKRTKEVQCEISEDEGFFVGECASRGLELSDVVGLLCCLEECLGVVLHCCFCRVEAVQTLDFPLVVSHFGVCWARALGSGFSFPVGQFRKKQEYLVNEYLRLLLVHLDVLPEEEIMEILLKNDVAGKMLTLLTQYHKNMHKEEIFSILGALARIVDTEHFKTYTNRYFTQQQKNTIIQTHKDIVLPVAKANTYFRRQLRPFNDFILRQKIKINKYKN